MKEPYVALLNKVNAVVRGTVQNAFWLTNNCQTLQKRERRPADSDAEASCQPVGGAVNSKELSPLLSAQSNGGMVSLSITSPPFPQLPEKKTLLSFLRVGC